MNISCERRPLQVYEIVKSLSISENWGRYILLEDSGIRNASASWVSHLFKADPKQTEKRICQKKKKSERFHAVDETRVHLFTPENNTAIERARIIISDGKVA